MYRLSKSKIMSGRQCPKRLYLEVHQPELVVESPSTNQVQWWGDEVLRVARALNPDGVLIGQQADLRGALKETRLRLTESPLIPLFEPAFEHDGVLVRSDLLFPHPSETRMVEVKAATSLKDYHLEDCAIQVWVIESWGLPLKRIELGLVDTSFIYGGDGNYQGLLIHEDVTDEVRLLQKEVPQWVKALREVLEGPLPDIEVGNQCGDPFECPFLAHCSVGQPEYPLSCLPRGKKIAGELMAEGILDLRDIPPGRLTNLLHEKVRRVTVAGKPEVDSQAGKYIRSLSFPRHYLDFETIEFAVPVWAGTSPYQQLPFQWSCHIEDVRGKIGHQSCLDTSGEPPMRGLAENLIKGLGDKGPILVYSPFEKTVLNRLARLFPDLSNHMSDFVDRLVDLLPVTRKHYYHPDMKGSWSIKTVLPTIAPDLDYGSFEEVSDGQAAQRAYLEIINPQTPEERREKLRAELLDYCELDTLAMVRLAMFFEKI